jgi:citrate lyase subunit beta/citryl-CoA lyase
VRVNAIGSAFAFRDFDALIGNGLDGLVLPKVSKPQDIEIADWLIGQFERERGLPALRVDLVPMIETAAAMANIREILRACPRVRRCAFGAVDLALDLGLEPSSDDVELHALRTNLVLAARAEDKEPPIDSAFMRVADTEGFKESVARARAFGFQGKLCIHPSQVEAANAGFLPSERQLTEAGRIVEAFEAAQARGSAVTLLDGNLIELPVVERARALLAAAEASEAQRGPAPPRRA